MMQHLKELRVGTALIPLLFRFVSVGAIASLAYVVAVAFYVEVFAAGPKSASLLAYITAFPISYIGHRKVTFRSDGRVLLEIVRFIVLHTANIFISLTVMLVAVDSLGYSYWIGSLTNVVFVPLTTFVVMKLWVFSHPENRGAKHPSE